MEYFFQAGTRLHEIINQHDQEPLFRKKKNCGRIQNPRASFRVLHQNKTHVPTFTKPRSISYIILNIEALGLPKFHPKSLLTKISSQTLHPKVCSKETITIHKTLRDGGLGREIRFVGWWGHHCCEV
jgi:hypothetical protein